MAPLPRSAIMSAVVRTRFQQAAARQFRVRQYATARAARLEQAPGHWGTHWKRAGGTAMMYFPVVAVVMFWPYIVEPIVNIYEGV